MSVDEIECVEECPTCGLRFIGMSPDEYRETHAVDECPKAPLGQLYIFPTAEARKEARASV